jgi:hypothetical protein
MLQERDNGQRVPVEWARQTDQLRPSEMQLVRLADTGRVKVASDLGPRRTYRRTGAAQRARARLCRAGAGPRYIRCLTRVVEVLVSARARCPRSPDRRAQLPRAAQARPRLPASLCGARGRARDRRANLRILGGGAAEFPI